MGIFLPQLTLEIVCQWKRDENVTYYFLSGIICLPSFLPFFPLCSPVSPRLLGSFRDQLPLPWLGVSLCWILSSGSILLSWSFCSKYVFYPFVASLLNLGGSRLLCLSSSHHCSPARSSAPAQLLGKISVHFRCSFSLCIHFPHPAFSRRLRRRPQVRALGTSCAGARDAQFSWLPGCTPVSKSPASRLRLRLRLRPASSAASTPPPPAPQPRSDPGSRVPAGPVLQHHLPAPLHPAGRRPGAGAAGPPARQLLLRAGVGGGPGLPGAPHPHSHSRVEEGGAGLWPRSGPGERPRFCRWVRSPEQPAGHRLRCQAEEPQTWVWEPHVASNPLVTDPFWQNCLTCYIVTPIARGPAFLALLHSRNTEHRSCCGLQLLSRLISLLGLGPCASRASPSPSSVGEGSSEGPVTEGLSFPSRQPSLQEAVQRCLSGQRMMPSSPWGIGNPLAKSVNTFKLGRCMGSFELQSHSERGRGRRAVGVGGGGIWGAEQNWPLPVNVSALTLGKSPFFPGSLSFPWRHVLGVNGASPGKWFVNCKVLH